ncbi:bifunctional diaminohydroxyphosphoribosylaminopyrimidine deaminase/5-amino-6-(5-phosphoribosylamino)uracil reductase RibD [Gramella sp. AN32]|uniref:Riboflavin biosynthesis protein RibD n=1 Tax=Christiangramia antarctica TaxID=2058158 RepID=A0ABW5X5D0_9FLAO|nr:bifunctional diaminohydroxyphosphoribosylaminopyrimidine deaminase/5-amino-6-(5-phosphoribosylamino)uracil reductase RibD [Gramella sp. AN32]
MKIHEKYIKRCIQLAEGGLGTTYPNPLVGSVIVHNNKIIGEGWHRKAGETHAEVNAINSVKDFQLLPESTIYVSLEPCSHFGKTPPCSDLIVERGIKRVVIGTMDPFAKVAGKGIKKLMEAGCEVMVGVLEEECKALNKRFFTFHKKQRPYIILKWAETANGFIAPQYQDQRRPVWITNPYSKQLVHKWRTEEQAILVGTNTAIQDNPKLNSRNYSGNDPIRIVLDQYLKIPADSALYDQSQKTIIVCGKNLNQENTENLEFLEMDFSENIAQTICNQIYQKEIQSVIIEGGRNTLQQFIDAGLWDEARIFIGNSVFKKGIKAPEITGTLYAEEKIISDELKMYRND